MNLSGKDIETVIHSVMRRTTWLKLRNTRRLLFIFLGELNRKARIYFWRMWMLGRIMS